MKRIIAFARSLFGAEGAPSADLSEGGIYATQDEDGTFSVVKILKVDEGGVHLRMYSNQFDSVPDSIDETFLYMAGIDREPNERLGMGHAPISHQSFSTWGAVFVQQSSVTPEELEGYEMWKEGSGGYF